MVNTDCYGLDEFAKTLKDAASGDAGKASPQITKTTTKTDKAIQGKKTMDAVLDPIRQLKKEEETATGIQKQAIKDKIAAHWSDAGEKEATPEKIKITNDMVSDSDVKAYIHEMSIDEFAKTRMELQTIFGGAQARRIEMEYKDTAMKAFESELTAAGKYTPAVKQELSDMGARGILSDKDLDTLRAMEELKTFDDSIIAPGTSRKTYTSLRSKLGEPITNEIFAKKINDNITKTKELLKDQNFIDKLVKRTPTKEETTILNEIESGKRTLDASTFEFTNRFAEKISADWWKTIRGTITPLDELDGATRTTIQKQGWSKQSKIVTGLGVTAGAIWLATVTIPDKLNNWGQFGLTNAGEMSALFGQFDKDTSPNRLIELWFPTGARKTAMDLWLKSVHEYIGIMDNAYTIPFYGDWLKGTTFVGYASAIGSLGNLDTVMTALDNKGIAIKDTTTNTGWRERTDIEKKDYYTSNEKELFSTKDNEWIKKYGEMIYGKDGFTSDETPKTIGELSPTEIMAYYHQLKGDGYGTDLGMASKMFGFQQSEPTFIESVLEYGDTKEKELETKKTTTTTPSATGSGRSMEDMMKLGLTCEGKNCTQKVYDRLLGIRWTVYEDPITGKANWAQTQPEIPMDSKGNPAKILATGFDKGSSSGSSGGSDGGSDESTKSSKDAYAKNTLKTNVAKGKSFNDQSDNEKENQVRVLSFPEMKKVAKDTTLPDYVATAEKAGAGKRKEIVKSYVKEEIETMSKKEMDEAIATDGEATADAVIEKAMAECGE
jgi:hypothetical protein